MRGADLLVQTLSSAGVTTIFSLSGNQIMPVYDACVDAGIRIIHTRHEAAAVFMADAWAQLTGQIGVALVTAAPGFGNALGALYTARASESPIILLAGDSAVALDGRGAFQELDQVAAATPLVKLSFRPLDATQIGNEIAWAIRVARTGRPGPVHVALAFDVLEAEIGIIEVPGLADLAPESLDTQAEDIATIYQLLCAAERPVVLLGPRFNSTRAPGLSERLADAVAAPVVAMESPRGLNDPALGKLAHGLARADLILCLGKRVDFTLAFGAPAKFSDDCRWIVVDEDETERRRAKKNLSDRILHIAAADPEQVAQGLIAIDKPAASRDKWRTEFAALLAERNYTSADTAAPDAITSLALTRAISQAMGSVPRPVLICDGGEFGQWAQAVLGADDRLINGPSGAIGGCLCYALGASAARAQSTVFVIMGDGTAGFQFAEFETAARENLPFVAVIGNDRRWNAEVQIQLRSYGRDRQIGCELSSARYDLAVSALGGHGEYVTKPDELAGALQRAIESGKPACVNVEMTGLPAPVVSGH